MHLEKQSEQVARLERGLGDMQSSMSALMERLALISASLEGGIKKEPSPSPSAHSSAPASDPGADRIRALEDQLASLRAEALMGKIKQEKAPEAGQVPPEKFSKSMFLDISEGGEGTTTADKFGEVARALGKELKQVGSSSLKKNKLKTAASFLLWEKRFRKKLGDLEDLAALKRYLDFVGTISFVARHESWPVARYYAWRWLKLDRKALKKVSKGKPAHPPLAAEISNELLMRAKLKASAPAKDEGGKRKKSCFACGGQGHFASACTVPCSNCGGKGHAPSKCFREKQASGPASQSSQGSQLGGPLLHPQNPPVCSKCGRENHTAAQCRVR